MTLAGFLSAFRCFPQTLPLGLGPGRSEDRPHQPKIKARAAPSTLVFSMSFATKSSAPLRSRPAFFQSLPTAAKALLNTKAVLFVLHMLLQVQLQLSFGSLNSIPAHSSSICSFRAACPPFYFLCASFFPSFHVGCLPHSPDFLLKTSLDFCIALAHVSACS